MFRVCHRVTSAGRNIWCCYDLEADESGEKFVEAVHLFYASDWMPREAGVSKV